MNICFVTAGPIEWASSRMRAFWVAEALRARRHNVAVLIDKTVLSHPAHDAYIWQKKVDLPFVKSVSDIRHYWDVCDPSWWWQPNECREIAKHMTGIVASSQALANDFNEWYGENKAICIPDRLKLAHFHTQRQHSDVSPVRFIWFGIAANRVALWGARANLERLVANGHKIELTIFDDRPDVRFNFSDAFPIYHVLWSLEKEVEVLAAHDIALLPPYPGPWGEVKSDNKMLTAGACLLPDVSGLDYAAMEYLMESPQSRENYGKRLHRSGKFDIEQSAIEWEALLS